MANSKVSCSNITEMLQDMFRKNRGFILNITKVEENQKESWSGSAVEKPLKTVKDRLGYLSDVFKKILENRNIPVPSTPGSLNLTHTDDYTKIQYGWKVILALKAWITHVEQDLQKCM